MSLLDSEVSVVLSKVQALYDFEGQKDTEELSIQTGEILTITRTDVGEGWWEGTNSKGQTGLFPEAYVEKFSEEEAPPSMAPPPLPPDYGTTHSGGWTNPSNDDWGNSGWGLPTSTSNPQDNNWGTSDYQAGSAIAVAPHDKLTASTNQGFDQDEWDSDFDDQSDINPSTPLPNQGNMQSMGNLGIPKNSVTGGSTGDLSSGKKGALVTGRTSFNRFSPFVKTGSENYVLGKCNIKVNENEIISVIDMGDNNFSWENSNQLYNCAIASPKKESKLHGLKSYIAYQLTPSFNNIQVSRRYKHFDWLQERLIEKFAMIPIPPLPDKQIQGRYEEEFIEHRMNQLQSFVDRVCRHPVLSQCEVWQHFLTCTDEKKWKSGKRKAEKDALVGGNLFMAIRTPDKALDGDFVDRQVEIFTKFSTQFDSAVKNMLKICAEQTQKCQTVYKREYQMIGKSFSQLGSAMEQDPGTYSINLNNAVKCTGETYEEIAKMLDDQPRNDWEHLGDVMHDYRGMLNGWPGILQIHAGAIGKRKEFDRLNSEGKVNTSEATEVASRTDILSYALLAEINTFHQQRIKDMKQAHQNFLQEQIIYYQKVTEKLQDALRLFDNC